MSASIPAEQTRLRCISTILELDDEALQIVDTLLTRVAQPEKTITRQPRVKSAQAKRTSGTPTPSAEVTR